MCNARAHTLPLVNDESGKLRVPSEHKLHLHLVAYFLSRDSRAKGYADQGMNNILYSLKLSGSPNPATFVIQMGGTEAGTEDEKRRRGHVHNL